MADVLPVTYLLNKLLFGSRRGMVPKDGATMLFAAILTLKSSDSRNLLRYVIAPSLKIKERSYPTCIVKTDAHLKSTHGPVNVEIYCVCYDSV